MWMSKQVLNIIFSLKRMTMILFLNHSPFFFRETKKVMSRGQLFFKILGACLFCLFGILIAMETHNHNSSEEFCLNHRSRLLRYGPMKWQAFRSFFFTGNVLLLEPGIVVRQGIVLGLLCDVFSPATVWA